MPLKGALTLVTGSGLHRICGPYKRLDCCTKPKASPTLAPILGVNRNNYMVLPNSFRLGAVER